MEQSSTPEPLVLHAARRELTQAFAGFAALFVVRVCIALFGWANVPTYDRGSYKGLLILDLLTLLGLLVMYVAFALAARRACSLLGLAFRPYLTFFVSLPLVLIFLTVLPGLPLGFFIVNALTGSPIAVYLNLVRAIDDALREASALS